MVNNPIKKFLYLDHDLDHRQNPTTPKISSKFANNLTSYPVRYKHTEAKTASLSEQKTEVVSIAQLCTNEQ